MCVSGARSPSTRLPKNTADPSAGQGRLLQGRQAGESSEIQAREARVSLGLACISPWFVRCVYRHGPFWYTHRSRLISRFCGFHAALCARLSVGPLWFVRGTGWPGDTPPPGRVQGTYLRRSGRSGTPVVEAGPGVPPPSGAIPGSATEECDTVPRRRVVPGRVGAPDGPRGGMEQRLQPQLIPDPRLRWGDVETRPGSGGVQPGRTSKWTARARAVEIAARPGCAP